MSIERGDLLAIRAAAHVVGEQLGTVDMGTPPFLDTVRFLLDALPELIDSHEARLRETTVEDAQAGERATLGGKTFAELYIEARERADDAEQVAAEVFPDERSRRALNVVFRDAFVRGARYGVLGESK